MRHILILLILATGGCRIANGPATPQDTPGDGKAEIKRLEEADASLAVVSRTKNGDWRFLGWYFESPPRMVYPGLSREEIASYIESGRYGYEIDYDERSQYTLQTEGDMGSWLKAKGRYVERFNRALLLEIKRHGPK
jgi:hypothetical protein